MTLEIVDPHVHLWKLDQRGRYPWLDDVSDIFTGDYSAIARNYLPADFRQDAGDIEVVKVVHIDAAASDALRETEWLQELADGPDRMPDAIVARVDLSAADALQQIEAQSRYRNVRGIRQNLNVHSNPRLDFVGRHFMSEPQWRRNFKLLAKYGLSFDLQIYPSQMQQAYALAQENPHAQIILLHTGMFADRNSVAGYVEWRDGMRMLARCENVWVKISGMGMLDHSWSRESIRPYVLETLDAFGTARSMFASNFPVDRLYSSYSHLWHAYAEIVSDMDVDSVSALFRRNAERFYRI